MKTFAKKVKPVTRHHPGVRIMGQLADVMVQVQSLMQFRAYKTLYIVMIMSKGVGFPKTREGSLLDDR